jgi:3-hydroxyisobutyrate dehydrogenase-like beta-hydroxyacid dehydrogenase
MKGGENVEDDQISEWEKFDEKMLAITDRYFSKTAIQCGFRCKLCRQIIYSPNLLAHLSHEHPILAEKLGLDPDVYRYFGT